MGRWPLLVQEELGLRLSPRRTAAPIDTNRIRRFGFDALIVPGEYFPAFLHRIAAHVGEPPAAISRWCGLNTIPPQRRQRLTVEPSWDVADAIAAAVGCDPLDIIHGSMGAFSEDAVAHGLDELPAHAKNWTRGSGTRYCPLCLREQPDVFMAHWRLWWSFLCDKHLVPLREDCPSCWSPIPEPNWMERRPVTPSRCRTRLPSGACCGHDLRDTWTDEPFPLHSPINLAQTLITVAWSRNQPQLSLEIPDLEHLLSTARGVGIALLAAADIDLIARLARIPAEDLRGLFDEQTRIGTSPPKNSLAMGALMAAAITLMYAPEESVRPILRRLTFARPAKTGTAERGPGSAATMLSYWPDVGPRFRGRVLRAVDGDLSTMQRLVTGSMVRPNFDGYVVEVLSRQRLEHNGPRHWEIPALLWPSWACPLSVAGGANVETLQYSLSLALRAAIAGAETLDRGRYYAPDPDIVAGIGKQLRPAMLGTPAQTDAILGQLAELARYLRTNGSNIWYDDRLKLPWWELLHREHWQAVVESVGETPGRGKALLNARRYLFLRATAQPTRALPKQWRVLVDGYDAADLTDFHIRMSAELKTALDAYLAVWLDRAAEAVELRRKDTAPSQPVWSPPRWRGSGLAALGPELLDIDLTLLHDHLRDGVTAIRTLARVAHRSPNHVRWTLQEHPASTGRPISPIDWNTELQEVRAEPWRRAGHRRSADSPGKLQRANLVVWERTPAS
ncbi:MULTISPECIES: TniQ family protein [unclassified Curtobacterium]|uniref:TniQ family protein n=1 Tax=unclassified Curtobacterium TaxID=257496 RepID=UPI003A7F8648